MSILAKVRKDLMTSGHSEAEALGEAEGLQAIFQDLQDLRRERNVAKRTAMRKVDEEYDEAQNQLERRYAMMMKLSARTTEK